jgi:molecular chaperone GrpE (heat shock protein)
MPDDDPLDNKPWLSLIEECVDLYDELERLQPSLEIAAQELVDHCRCRLLEILQRSGVSILAEDAAFDRSRHQAEALQESACEGTPIAAMLSPGFAVGRRVFRRARVKLAPSIVPTEEPSP